LLTACPSSSPRDADVALPRCPLADVTYQRALDDLAPEVQRLEAVTKFLHDAHGTCDATAQLPKLEGFVDEVLLVCVVDDIKGGRVTKQPRVDFAALRDAIDAVGGPRRDDRHDRVGRCSGEVARSLCDGVADVPTCVRSAMDRLLH
jgi:hypothetical protein